MAFHDFNHFRKLLDQDFNAAYGDKSDQAFEQFLQHILLFFTSAALRDFEKDKPGVPVPPYLDTIRSFFQKIIESENEWTRSPHFLSSRCLLHLRYHHYHNVQFEGPSLDLGCGDGYTVNLAVDATFDCATDLIHSDLLKLRKFEKHRTLFAADARALPLPDSHFKTVMCNYTLCHIGNKRGVLEEVHRVMQPGGWFYFDDISARMFEFKDRPFPNLLSHLGSQGLAKDFRNFYHTYYDSGNKWDVPTPPEQTCKLLEELGFTNVEFEYAFAKETMEIGYFFLDMVPFLQRELYYESKQYRDFIFERLARCVNMDRALCKERNEGNFVYFKAQKK